MRRRIPTKAGAAFLAVTLLYVPLAACGTPDPSKEAEAGSSDSADQRYSCGSGDGFTAKDVAAERQPSEEVLDALEALRGTVDGAFLPENGWIEVNAEGTNVTVIAPRGKAYASAIFETRDGKWAPSGWGECVPRLQVPGRSVLRWAFTNASYPPSSDATEIEVLVSEVGCSSGRDIDDLIESAISYEEERISVILTAPGLSGNQTCPGKAPVSYTVRLEEPPGQRDIVDPSVFPAVEPTPGTRLP